MKLTSTLKTLGCALAMSLAIAAPALAQEQNVKKAMATLIADTNAVGAPRSENGVLYFGSSKINDNFEIVDAVKAKHGGTATLFVKKGSSFVRISTNVMKGSNRAVGTQLDAGGPAYAANNAGTAFYGVVDILGKLYDTGYEPIKNAAGEVIGIYYVGYMLE